MKKAFTLIELVVAVALLVMVMSFTSVIFKVSIQSQRVADANAEIVQKLRSITDQLNADFKGMVWSVPPRIMFDTEPSDINGHAATVRADSIVFFASGDFQSTLQYGSSSKIVIGNVASILYSLADNHVTNPRKKILVRRQTILTLTQDPVLPDFGPKAEYYEKSLSEWKINAPITQEEWVRRPALDANDAKELVMYMARGVDDFTVQYVGKDNSGKKFNEWRPLNGEIAGYNNTAFNPTALKFTFTIYDSKGVIKNGSKFTQIVYLKN